MKILTEYIALALDLYSTILFNLYILGSFKQEQKTVTIGYEHAQIDFVRSSSAGDQNVTSVHTFKRAL